RLPGVMMAEPFVSAGVEIRSGHLTRRIGVSGHTSSATLTRLLDSRGRRVVLPEQGLLISEALAKLLHVGVGDTVGLTPLDGRRGERQVIIAGLVESYLGLAAYMEIDALDRLLGRNGQISGANLAVDPGRQPEL